MRTLIWLAAIGLTGLTGLIGLIAPLASHAQATANPIVSSAREIFASESMSIAAAAEQMPAAKFSYHPTPGQRSFGGIAAHIAQSDNVLCGMLAGAPAPQGPEISEASPKATVVSAVKASFAFCAKVLANLPDSKLDDTITFYRGRHVARARALFELTSDLEDHYSQMASYLRLNGMIPPSAEPRR